jgi:carbonic anhydrase
LRCGSNCPHGELLHAAEEEIVLLSAENLKHYPSVATALAEGRVTIRPWIFNMELGELFHYDDDSKKFVSLTTHKKSENA